MVKFRTKEGKMMRYIYTGDCCFARKNISFAILYFDVFSKTYLGTWKAIITSYFIIIILSLLLYPLTKFINT